MFRCDVCTEAWERLFRFFCQEPQALTTGEDALEALRASKGFCAFHTWMLTRYASPRNLSVAYPPLLEDASAALLALVGQGGLIASKRIQEWSGPPHLCPACRVLAEAEREVVGRLRQGVLEAGLEGAPSLCLRHLADLLPGLDAEQAGPLLRDHAERGIALAEGHRGYAAKFDARHRHLMTDDERTAHRDALVFLTGERDLAGPSAWRPHAGGREGAAGGGSEAERGVWP